MRQIVVVLSVFALAVRADIAGGQQASRTAQATQTRQTWALEESRSEMTDEPAIILSIAATDDVQGWLDRFRPSLVVRCHERKLEVYLVTGMSSHVESAHREHTVRYRIDTTTAVTDANWTESTDNKSLFAPAPKELAERLMSASTVLMEWTPLNANPVRARFPIAGLEAHRARLVAACPGSLSPLSVAERAAFAASPEGKATHAIATFKALVDSNPRIVGRWTPGGGAIVSALLGARTQSTGGGSTTIRIAAVQGCSLTVTTTRHLSNLTAHDTAWLDLATLARSPTVRSKRPTVGWALVLATETGEKTILTHQWTSRDRRPKTDAYSTLFFEFENEETAREGARLAAAAIGACRALSA